MNVLVTASNSRISVAAAGDITKAEKNLLLDIQYLSVKYMPAENNAPVKELL